MSQQNSSGPSAQRCVDCTSAAFIREPYATLASLREHDPVYWHRDLKSWCLTRYQHVTSAFHDNRFSADRVRSFVDSRPETTPDLDLLGDCVGLWMVFNDPPVHTRLRKLTSRVFTKWNLERIARPVIQRQVSHLLDTITQRSEVDFVKEFAWPLPAAVIADLLGVPQQHMQALKTWSDDLATFVLDSRNNADKYAVAASGLANMNALFEEIIASSRMAARQGEQATIIDQLVAVHDESDGLSTQELVAFCVLLLFAGHETTAHFLANGLAALIRNPEQKRDLAANSTDVALVNNAVNEMLRYDGPILSISRTVTEDLDFEGRRLKRGDRVYLFNAAANRDPRVFANADAFDVRREDASRMIGFGYGIHLCLGIHLARLEGAIAFPALINRVADFELRDDMRDWTDTLVMRGPKHMRVGLLDRP